MFAVSSFIGFASLVHLVAQWPLRVQAFGFTFTPPTQCDNLNISWTGGRGPFSLLITPFFKAPINISLPDSAFDDSANAGSYSIQLPLQAEQQFLLTLSDATGLATGGTSGVLTVGSSVSGASCNTTGANPAFTFQLNSALQQCEDFTFEAFNGSVPPVKILGLIPLGQAFELDVPSGADSFDWIASVSAGTSITFLMVDADDRSGGSSDLRTVDQSNDASCLNSSSPHSTADASSTATVTGDAVPSATQTVEVKSATNTGAIVGAVLGGLALLGLILLGALLCLRRRRRKSASNGDGDMFWSDPAVIGSRDPSRMSRAFRPPRGRRAPPSFDLLHSSSRSLHRMSIGPGSVPVEEEALPNPYVLPSSNSASVGHSTPHQPSFYNAQSPQASVGHSTQHDPSSFYNVQSYHSAGVGAAGQLLPLSQSQSRSENEGPRSPASALTSPYSQHDHQGHARRPSMPYSVVSGRTSKSSAVGTTRSAPRLILHTDAEDPGPDDDGEVIELPPQYNDRGFTTSNEKEPPPPRTVQ